MCVERSHEGPEDGRRRCEDGVAELDLREHAGDYTVQRRIGALVLDA